MPQEYSNTFSHVYCNDCEKKSYAKFHFMYHKCGFCLGYNTKLISTSQGLPPNAQIAPPLNHSSQIAQMGSSTTSLRSINSSVPSIVSSAQSSNYWCHQCQVIILIRNPQRQYSWAKSRGAKLANRNSLKTLQFKFRVYIIFVLIIANQFLIQKLFLFVPTCETLRNLRPASSIGRA